MILLSLNTLKKSIKIVQNVKSLFGEFCYSKNLLFFNFFRESLMDQFCLIFLSSQQIDHLFKFALILLIDLIKLLHLALRFLNFSLQTNQVLNFLNETFMLLRMMGLDMSQTLLKSVNRKSFLLKLFLAKRTLFFMLVLILGFIISLVLRPEKLQLIFDNFLGLFFQPRIKTFNKKHLYFNKFIIMENITKSNFEIIKSTNKNKEIQD